MARKRLTRDAEIAALKAAVIVLHERCAKLERKAGIDEERRIGFETTDVIGDLIETDCGEDEIPAEVRRR